MKAIHLVVIVLVMFVLASCTAAPITRGTAATVSEPTEIPKQPNPTNTLTSTIIPTLTPTPIPTMTPTAFPLPTLEGRTALGDYMEKLASDLGFTLVVTPLQVDNVPTHVGALRYQIVGSQASWVNARMLGYEINTDAPGFLLISYGDLREGNMSLWGTYGFGLSLYYGSIPSECQGTDQIFQEAFLWCMESIQSGYSMVSDDNLYWYPAVAYPLNMSQLQVLNDLYGFKLYPELTKVMGIEWEKK
jgi:hypothetical protein